MNLARMPIDLAREADFALGRTRVRPALRQFATDNSQRLIEPRVMQVLVALARRANTVVSRDELVDLCWAGRIVGEDAIQRAIAKVRRLGEASNAFVIETIAKVGYRLIPTEPHAAVTADREWTIRNSKLGRNGLPASWLPEEAALPDAVLDLSEMALSLTRLPSIGVLPFLNLTGDPGQDYFVDGVTEDIITALSRFHEIRTAPRGSTFAIGRMLVDPAEIARNIGVHYVLTGSIRMADGRVRVSAELVQGESGAQVWRDGFDRALTGIFELQDELSRSVAAVLVPALRNAEVERAERKPARDLSAYDLYLRALPHMWAGTKKGVVEAIALLRQSLEREVNPATLAALAFSLLTAPPLGAPLQSEAAREALRHARGAIALDAGDAFAQAIYAIALAVNAADRGQVIPHAQKAVRLNPSSAFAWGALGTARCLLGDFDHGIESLELAVRLGPSDDVVYLWLSFLATAHFALERYAESIAAAREAVLNNPNFGTAHRLLAASLALSGSVDEAHTVTRQRDLAQRTTLGEIHAMRLFQQEPIMERYLAAQAVCGVEP